MDALFISGSSGSNASFSILFLGEPKIRRLRRRNGRASRQRHLAAQHRAPRAGREGGRDDAAPGPDGRAAA